MAEEPWKDADQIRRLYCEEELSITEMSEMLDCARSVVHNWIDKHGIEPRDRSNTPDPWENLETPWRDVKRLRELYCERLMSVAEVAEELGCAAPTVRRWMRRHNIEVRGNRSLRISELHDGDWLRKKYVMEGNSMLAIGESLGCSAKAVKTALKRAEIDLKKEVETYPTGEEHWAYNSNFVECEYCGVEKDVPMWKLDRHEMFFCNNSCRGQWLSKNNVGENHPRWEGGTARYGPGWNISKKRKIRRRDGHQCQDCAMTQKKHLEEYNQKLHVHHITPARKIDDPGVRHAERNLVTLCTRCHSKWERMAPLRPDTTQTAND